MNLPDASSVFAREGSCAHQVAQSARGKQKPAAEWIGKEYFGVKVDREMAAGVQEFIDYVEALPGDDYNEERIYYREYVTHGFGTMDAAKALSKVVHMIDLKYGKGVQVFAEHNTQLMLYALGFYLTYGWLYGIEGFWLTVFQPRLQHVDSWYITLEDLLTWAEEEARPRAKLAMQVDAPRRAGSWCKFCRLKNDCSTRAVARGKASADVSEMTALDADSDF